jgi:hypothetical protein
MTDDDDEEVEAMLPCPICPDRNHYHRPGINFQSFIKRHKAKWNAFLVIPW